MLSPRSRGKGSRRGPWRDGGRGKRKAIAWQKQAIHAVEAFPEEAGKIVALSYFFPTGHSAAESIYLFDQRIAGTGIHYRAELVGSGISAFFTIRVPVSAEARVSAIIAQLNKR